MILLPPSQSAGSLLFAYQCAYLFPARRLIGAGHAKQSFTDVAECALISSYLMIFSPSFPRSSLFSFDKDMFSGISLNDIAFNLHA